MRVPQDANRIQGEKEKKAVVNAEKNAPKLSRTIEFRSRVQIGIDLRLENCMQSCLERPRTEEWRVCICSGDK